MKKLFVFLLFLFCLIPMKCFSLVQPSNVLYVTDEANVLTQETEDYIVLYSDYLNRMEKVHYYVVTVKNLENFDVHIYAEEVFRIFDVGENGVLIFFAKEERTIKVIAGEKISSFIDTNQIEEVINLYFMPYFKNDDWDQGIKNGYTAYYKMICDYYEIDSSPMEVKDGNDILTKYRLPIIIGLTILGSMIGYLFFLNLKKGRRRRDFKHFIIFGLCLLVNVLILMIGYQIEPISVILILGSEVITYSSVFQISKPISLNEAARLYELDQIKKKKEKKKHKIRKRKSK